MNHPYQNPYYAPDFAPPSPNQTERRTLRSAAGFVGILMLFLTVTMQFAYTVVALFLTYIGFLPQGGIFQDQLGLDNTTYLWVYACVYVLAMGLPLILVLFWRRLFTSKPLKTHPTGGIGFLAVLGSVGGCMGANIVTGILMAYLEYWGVPMPEMPQMMEQTPVSLLMNVFVIAVLPAVLEEAVFRGCVLRVLRPYGDGFALVVSAILFGLMHGNVRQIPFALIVGLVLGWLYVTTNSIWWPMLIHFINNALSVCMEYLAFDMGDTATGVFYGGIIYGLAIVGAVAAIIMLFTRGDQLRLRPSTSCLRTGQKISVVCKSPAFLISLIVFIVLTGMELMG